MIFGRKKTECSVCGYRFIVKKEMIYTAEEPRAFVEMLTTPPTRFSAVDCPRCGCQISLAIRRDRADDPEIPEGSETEGSEVAEDEN